ncbi:MAG TPA: hypothetical protein PLJ27_03415 [Polyangiaceae bacterium]|jgi:hypothetical protein|nr:MAG: hypothetical protein BWY17_00369 [Deltaproteobacteria bacterium ADurb.Bin207]HNS96109.1 hypothetical protein [Polyangiaceae bacterium]HNZ22144.1 hypothetical protein [Polyangiaceae bacterium]HOD21360.1 hypothetical protein [Polyangiaceae bacterium]HOE46968.1 hypothetical protein [Polyangiaceae bacterium]
MNPWQGPGIRKVRHPHPETVRVLSFVQVGDAFWSSLLEDADVISEGATSPEGSSLVYRGSTSIMVRSDTMALVTHGSKGRAMIIDPHLRLRAMRIARREAQARAPGMLGPLQMDLFVHAEARALRIDIDVDAVVEHRASRMGREA